MDPNQPHRLIDLLSQALDIPLGSRRRFLDDRATEDPGLRAEIDRLLGDAIPTRSVLGSLVHVLSTPDPDLLTAQDVATVTHPHIPATSDEPRTLDSGDELGGRYRIERFIARGGMGEVYRALDLDLGVQVALKTLRWDLARDPAALRLLKREILMARSVSHPNVCRIYDLGRDVTRRISFLTMEYLPGQTLGARLRAGGRIESRGILPLARQIADALDASHRAGIVHGDFKSENVVLVSTNGTQRAVITDFGLAMVVREQDDGSTSARGGLLAGTPAYMSPEQVTGDAVGPASDLYALGVVLFEMTTGRLPFHGNGVAAMARARLTTDPPLPSTLAPIDAPWEEAILRLLARDPAKRFPSAGDAVLALEGRVERAPAIRHALRAERDVFVGRDAELGNLEQQLESDGEAGSDAENGNRLLTLLGPGGSGKTRLALHYGWRSLSRWPGGVWFCDLSDARTREGVAHSLASTLNVPLEDGDPIAQLGHALAGRPRGLVILDNFEQVAEHAATTVGAWLERAPTTRFLITSRERLRVVGERVHELEPMDPTTHGAELFVARVREHRPDFTPSETDMDLVNAIVRDLDGLPLAIELAASRVRVLSLASLKDRLADRFRLLSGGTRGRHATLQATLDWSWDLLEPWERSALAQASVFEGGISLEAVEEVIDLASWGSAPPTLDVLQSLVDKSWLRARAMEGVPRFEMLATIREYASLRLRSPSESEAAVTPDRGVDAEVRHGEYFASLGTEDAIETLDTHGGETARAALALELENLMAACARAVDRNDPATAVPTGMAAIEVLMQIGPMATGIALGGRVLGLPGLEPADRARVLDAVAQALTIVGHTDEPRTLVEEALAIHRELGDRKHEGVAIGRLGGIDRDDGHMDRARYRFEESLAILREGEHRAFEGIVLTSLGSLDVQQGRMDEAQRNFELALSIHRALGNRRDEGVLLNFLGSVLNTLGRKDEAREYYQEALAIHREMGHPRLEAIVLGNIAEGYGEQGKLDTAREILAQSLRIHCEVGSRPAEGDARMRLGVLYARQSRLEEAQPHFEEALAIARELGLADYEGRTLANLGTLHSQMHRPAEARRCLEAALAIQRQLGDRHNEGAVLGNLANLLTREGRRREAKQYLEDALAIHREVGSRMWEGVTLNSLGSHELDQGQLDEAERYYRNALAIHEEIGNRSSVGITHGYLGHLFIARGRHADAHRHLEQSVAIFREMGDEHRLVDHLCIRGDSERRLGDLTRARATLAEAEAIAARVDLVEGAEPARNLAELREALGHEPM